ncbi:hypothetical protein [Metapseudomonas otitidis]|uniref:hypothetical protein n=1 Tax=Metapseudomonas otitidis TaxID=319939 RepID=UPI001F293895|nr:hypothetical protein [Pseudomonas otitidis]
MKKSKRLYQCYSCLRESTDPIRCTNCGALIEELDLAGAMFIPPVGGYVVVENFDQEILEVVRRITGEVTSDFYHNFYISEVAGKLLVKCNDYSASLLIPRLEQELSGRKPSPLIYFEGKSG